MLLQQSMTDTPEREAERLLQEAARRSDAFLRAQEAKIEALRRVRAGKSLRRVAVNGRN